jgi:hypothetical protein
VRPAPLLLVAILVLMLAGTCSRRDELLCVAPEKLHHCQIDCMMRRCNEEFFHYEPGRIEVPMCATDTYAALGKFWQIVVQIDRKDCGDPRCDPVADTGSALMPGGGPAGGSFHEQAETESGATGGWVWEPLPGETCMP